MTPNYTNILMVNLDNISSGLVFNICSLSQAEHITHSKLYVGYYFVSGYNSKCWLEEPLSLNSLRQGYLNHCLFSHDPIRLLR